MSSEELELAKMFRYRKEKDWVDIIERELDSVKEAVKASIELRSKYQNGSINEKFLAKTCSKIATGVESAKDPYIREYLRESFELCRYFSKDSKDYDD